MFVATVVVSVLLALVALGSATAKLTKQPKLVEQVTGLGEPVSWLPRLAAPEVAGAVGLVVGLAVPAIGIAAGVGLVAYFLGVVAARVRAKDAMIASRLILAAVSIVAVVRRALTCERPEFLSWFRWKRFPSQRRCALDWKLHEIRNKGQ